jgi:hypothetical protein
MKSGTYFSLRGSGVDIWRLIEANASCAGIVEALEGRFDAFGTERLPALFRHD